MSVVNANNNKYFSQKCFWRFFGKIFLVDFSIICFMLQDKYAAILAIVPELKQMAQVQSVELDIITLYYQHSDYDCHFCIFFFADLTDGILRIFMNFIWRIFNTVYFQRGVEYLYNMHIQGKAPHATLLMEMLLAKRRQHNQQVILVRRYPGTFSTRHLY